MPLQNVHEGTLQEIILPYSYCGSKADLSYPTGLKHFYIFLCAFWIQQLREKLIKLGNGITSLKTRLIMTVTFLH